MIGLMILVLVLLVLFGGLGAAVSNLFFIGLVVVLVLAAFGFFSGWGRRRV